MDLKNSMLLANMMSQKSMPERYQEVEYIESTGTQCILTNYNPSYKTKIDVKISDFSGSWIWGARNSISSDVDFGSAYYFSSFGKSKLNYSDLRTGTHIINYGQTLIVDGVTIGTFPDTTSEIDIPILIFGIRNNNNTNSSVSAGKIYYFKILEGTRLVRNFIPVYDTETQKYGMWESVQGKFYGNAGTGDFGGSIVGYTIVGSPTITDGVVSGFSASDYLTISHSLETVNSIEIIIKVQDIASTITHTGLIIGLNGNLNSRLAIGTNGRVQCNYRDVDNTTRYLSSSKQASEYNYIRVMFNTTGASLDVSTDGITWINEYTREEIPNLTSAFTSCSMGYISNTYNSFEGSINMPKTSIKLNNKLWFNGQEG